MDFRTFLLNTFLECNHLIKSNLTEDFINLSLKKIADNFYSKFKNTNIPIKKIPVYYSDYHSIAIMFDDGTGLGIPFFFYQQAKLDSPPDYTEILSTDLGWYNLLSNIFEKANSSIVKLTSVDINVLRALTFYKRNPLFKDLDVNNKSFLFQINSLAKIVRSGDKWVSQRLNYLIQNAVLKIKYIVNPFLFGLETYSILYEKSFDGLLTDIDKYSLIKLRLRNHVMRVVQIPNNQENLFFNYDFSYELTRLSQMNIFNNLSDLKTNNSFSKVPDFNSIKAPLPRPIIELKDSKQDWIQLIKQLHESEKYSYYPVLSKLSIDKRLSVVIKIINYLAKWGRPQGNLNVVSKSLGINVSIFMETCRFLFNYDIIAFFPRITRIGCSNRYGIYIKTEETAVIDNIYSNLLELPHSVTFLGENTLVAYITLPGSYINQFLDYLANIALNEDLFIEYGRFISLKSWGRFNIQIPKGTTIDEYGVNYPHRQRSSQKIF